MSTKGQHYKHDNSIPSEKVCLQCNSLFKKRPKNTWEEWRNKKFCKYQCYWSARKVTPLTPKQKTHIATLVGSHKGHKHSELTKKHLSEIHKGRHFSSATEFNGSYSGSEHYLWKGDRVGYVSLHEWVARHKGQPNICESCGKSGLTGHAIHWANVSHEYLRELTDWVRLCVKCHRAYDTGRMQFELV